LTLPPIQGNECIGRHELGLEVWQRADATVLGLILVGALVANEGDEEAQFRYLNGNGLNVYPVDAVLNQVKLASVIKIIRLKVFLNSADRNRV
jgi:hypothetical protein